MHFFVSVCEICSIRNQGISDMTKPKRKCRGGRKVRKRIERVIARMYEIEKSAVQSEMKKDAPESLEEILL